MNKVDKNPSEVKLKPIKLIVKKPTEAKEDNNIKINNSKEIKKIVKEQQIVELFSSIKILLVIILLICTITLITNIAKEQNKPITSKPILPFKSLSTGLYSNWQTANGYTFTFEDNNTFYIYESGLYIQNNYYEGSYEYKEGLDAITELGYSDEDDFKNEFNIDTYQNIYSLHLTPNKYMKNDNNIINRKVEKNEIWLFILVLIDNDNAIAYNKTLDVRYQLTRN